MKTNNHQRIIVSILAILLIIILGCSNRSNIKEVAKEQNVNDEESHIVEAHIVSFGGYTPEEINNSKYGLWLNMESQLNNVIERVSDKYTQLKSWMTTDITETGSVCEWKDKDRIVKYMEFNSIPTSFYAKGEFEFKSNIFGKRMGGGAKVANIEIKDTGMNGLDGEDYIKETIYWEGKGPLKIEYDKNGVTIDELGQCHFFKTTEIQRTDKIQYTNLIVLSDILTGILDNLIGEDKNVRKVKREEMVNKVEFAEYIKGKEQETETEQNEIIYPEEEDNPYPFPFKRTNVKYSKPHFKGLTHYWVRYWNVEGYYLENDSWDYIAYDGRLIFNPEVSKSGEQKKILFSPEYRHDGTHYFWSYQVETDPRLTNWWMSNATDKAETLWKAVEKAALTEDYPDITRQIIDHMISSSVINSIEEIKKMSPLCIQKAMIDYTNIALSHNLTNVEKEIGNNKITNKRLRDLEPGDLIEEYYWSRFGPYPIPSTTLIIVKKEEGIITEGKITAVDINDKSEKHLDWEEIQSNFIAVRNVRKK